MIRVLVVEDHTALADALEGMMALEADLTCVAAVATGAAALAVPGPVEVALVDLDLPDGPGIDVVAELRGRADPAAVVVLTASTDPAELGRAVEAGANAVLHKATPVAEVFEVIRAVVGGRSALDAAAVTRWLMAAAAARERAWERRLAAGLLTAREVEVLRLLAAGVGSADIAQRLTIAEATVQTHIRNVRVKLGASSRLEAVVEARRLGLLGGADADDGSGPGVGQQPTAT